MFTARGMTRFNGNIEAVNNEYGQFTKEQIDGWGLKYHRLLMGKPAGEIYVDDRGIRDSNFFNDEMGE